MTKKAQSDKLILVSVRMTRADLKLIRAEAKKIGISFSAFMRGSGRIQALNQMAPKCPWPGDGHPL